MSPEYLKRSNFNKQFLKTSPPFDNVNNLNLSNPDNKQFFANTEYLAGYHDAEREYCTGKAFTDKEANPWIPINDRKPQNGQYCIIATADGGYDMCYYMDMGEMNMPFPMPNQLSNDGIVAWMPVPEYHAEGSGIIL